MGDVINLRAARKRKARAAKESLAVKRRTSFGQKRSDRTRADLTRDLMDKQFEAHRRERDWAPDETS